MLRYYPCRAINNSGTVLNHKDNILCQYRIDGGAWINLDGDGNGHPIDQGQGIYHFEINNTERTAMLQGSEVFFKVWSTVAGVLISGPLVIYTGKRTALFEDSDESYEIEIRTVN